MLSGEFTVVNQHLLSDLTALGLWSADTKNELVAANGSVQVMHTLYVMKWAVTDRISPEQWCKACHGLTPDELCHEWKDVTFCKFCLNNCNIQGLDIPDELKALYKTVWELRQRTLVEMAADRGAFIDQSQSFNVHMSEPNFGKLTSLHFHAWKVNQPFSVILIILSSLGKDVIYW